VFSAAPLWLPGSAAQAAISYRAALPGPVLAWEELARGEEKRLTAAHLLPALRCYLRARDLAPLMAEPHLQIAVNVDHLARAEPRAAYLARAKLLFPTDPDLWFVAGQQELLDERPADAVQSWRRSLDLSSRYLPEILAVSATQLDPRVILDQLLPDKPSMLFAAAKQLYPEATASEQRQPFLDKALALLTQQGGARTAEEIHLQASIQAALGQTQAALENYKTALARDPRQSGWRLELAKLLYQQRRLHDAQRELRLILAQHPGLAEVQGLLQSVEQEIREGK
jgi:Tfp pilus assembly protein PilF